MESLGARSEKVFWLRTPGCRTDFLSFGIFGVQEGPHRPATPVARQGVAFGSLTAFRRGQGCWMPWAPQSFRSADIKAEMLRNGIFVRAGDAKLLAEEAGGAYKNVTQARPLTEQ